MDLALLIPVLAALLGAVGGYVGVWLRGAAGRKALTDKIEAARLEASAKIEAAKVEAAAKIEASRAAAEIASREAQITQNQYFFKLAQEQTVTMSAAIAAAAAADAKADLLQKDLQAERDKNGLRDQQIGKLEALIMSKDAQITTLTATVARLETEINKANEQLKLANEQLTRVLHAQAGALPGGHTAATRADNVENVRKDAAAFAGPSEPVVEAAIAPPGVG